MPLVRVHESSDGKLFKDYNDYVAHEEGVKFNAIWSKKFAEKFGDNDAELEHKVKQFIQANQQDIADLIESSAVKRKGGKKK